ncbi:transferrin-binding protein-like solute binding protein [Lonepinella sp. BR2882]|uniref:transferrin-binding protein-like solute binding protein n=1 Tax=Lonepinella sp. BR2882 TaxID=3095283 RepID=UPI003F6E3928
MQNPFKLSAIVIACGLALSACSSSSSSDGSNVTKDTQTQATKQAEEAAKKAAEEEAAKKAAEEEAAKKAAEEEAAKKAAEEEAAKKAAEEEAAKKAAEEAAKSGTNSFGVKTWTPNETANFDKITIDGVDVDLAKATETTARGNPFYVKRVFKADSVEIEGYDVDFSNATVISSKSDSYTFNNVVAGAAKVGDNQYLFVQGTKSTDTPTTGTATYAGGSLRFSSDNASNLFQASGITSGSFNAEVDFGEKTIKGSIRDNGLFGEEQEFSGPVSGNGFTATWDDKDTGKGLDGNFYGSQAAEVGGQFERSDSFGVFVGAKQ